MIEHENEEEQEKSKVDAFTETLELDDVSVILR